jgi:DNA adenine methylase
MKYMGSKDRIAKYILPIMLAERKLGQWWIEPFVGGANIIDKVKGNRIGSDLNPYVIDALLAIQNCVANLPKNNKEFTEDDYVQLRRSDEYQYKGYAGFAFSYGGKWLGGWRRDSKGQRDYVREAYRNALHQSPNLQGVKLVQGRYQDLQVPSNSLIYCDPPYEGTTQYNTIFDHEAFWQWCRDKTVEGHVVFVSEYVAPEGFVCIWQREIASSLTRDTGSKRGIEKLFKCKEE